MPDCPLADDCPSFTERIAGMGCQHYGDRGGKEWCNHYSQPIDELKAQPVTMGEEVIVEVTDIHESGAGVGRTEDGFIVLVDGLMPHCRARVAITRVHSNHARGDELERLPLEEEEPVDEVDDERAEDDDDDDDEAESATEDADEEESNRRAARRQRLGSRENFWGG